MIVRCPVTLWSDGTDVVTVLAGCPRARRQSQANAEAPRACCASLGANRFPPSYKSASTARATGDRPGVPDPDWAA